MTHCRSQIKRGNAAEEIIDAGHDLRRLNVKGNGNGAKTLKGSSLANRECIPSW
jgi:hypothetical protein